MASPVIFDPLTLRIIEVNTGLAENSVTVLDIYSSWKDWLLSSPANMGHPPAFRVVGGDERSPTNNLGSTFFLTNEWKFRPAEYSHKWVLEGNIFVDGGVGSVFTETLGAYTVHTETVVTDLITGLDSLFSRVSSIDSSIAAISAAIVAGTLTLEQATQLREIYKAMSLDATDNWIATPTQMRTQSGDIVIDISGDGETYSEGNRQ